MHAIALATATPLPETAAALALADFADDEARLLARRGPGHDAIVGALVDGAAAHERAARDAYADETGGVGYVPMREIRAAVAAYVDTLCHHCVIESREPGGDLCCQCEEVERRDQADFERDHSAAVLG